MSEEIGDEGIDYSAGIPDSLLGEGVRKQGIFDRIKAKFPRFRRTDSPEATLAGRIHAQLQRDAHQTLAQLQALKETIRSELEGHDDSHLWISFEAVVNPLLRDYEQIEKKLRVQPSDIESKTSALQCYNAWIDKAKLWVALSSHPHDRTTIMRAVVEHTMHVSDLIIDRDLKTLQDYVLHEVMTLGLDPNATTLLNARLDSELAEHIAGLTALKHNKPDDLQIEHLQAWKAKVDEARDLHYNAALQVIDHILSSVAPVPLKEEVQEHLKEFFNRLAFLEEEIPLLIYQWEHSDPTNAEQRRSLEDTHLYLEITLHQMNQDLRLTPELAKRVIDLMESLNEAKKLFRDTA